MKFIKLLDGSYISAAYITRVHIVRDITGHTFDVIASTGGPQMPYTPYTVATSSSKSDAQALVDSLIAELERKAPLKAQAGTVTVQEYNGPSDDTETVHIVPGSCRKGQKHKGMCDYDYKYGD